ncbi:hypothetical protein BN126390086 [Stenotrophomonas indicatrix]|nr:hypothetical protein BN126390086 [Stenotrophomonas indicatrix]
MRPSSTHGVDLPTLPQARKKPLGGPSGFRLVGCQGFEPWGRGCAFALPPHALLRTARAPLTNAHIPPASPRPLTQGGYPPAGSTPAET